MNKRGFSLIEILVSIAILSLLFGLLVSSFSGFLNAWNRGTESVDQAHLGELLIDRMARMASSAFTNPESSTSYGFWAEGLESDGVVESVSWVSAGAQFFGMAESLGVSRLFFKVDEIDGEHGLWFKTTQPFLDEDARDEIEYQLLSESVRQLGCQFYDADEEEWITEWEQSNSIPARIQLTLWLDGTSDNEEWFPVSRVIDIPLGGTQ